MKHWHYAIGIAGLLLGIHLVNVYAEYQQCVLNMRWSNQILEHELSEMKEACWTRSNPFSLFR